MEHNIEKNIRLKVNEAEQYPVRWNKEEVWARMEIHRTKQSKRPVYFSMAASLTVAVLAGVYSYQRVTDIPDKTNATVRTESVSATAANTFTSEHNDIRINTKAPAPKNAVAQNIARIRIKEEDYISAPTFRAIATDTVATQEALPQANTFTDIPESTPAEINSENPDKRPKVIIGIIPPQEQRLVTQQEKKKKFRFLKGKSQDGDSDGNQLIIARIN
jgi:hypothetical protein